jgi:hypothetical protein
MNGPPAIFCRAGETAFTAIDSGEYRILNSECQVLFVKFNKNNENKFVDIGHALRQTTCTLNSESRIQLENSAIDGGSTPAHGPPKPGATT